MQLSRCTLTMTDGQLTTCGRTHMDRRQRTAIQAGVAPCVGAGGKDFIIYCNKYIRVTNSFPGLPSQTGACRATATTGTKKAMMR